MADDLDGAVRRCCDLFNTGVQTGQWAPFVASFTHDGTMTFVGARIGPFIGRSGIAAAYAIAPPVQTLSVDEVEPIDDRTARVRLTFESGDPGAMIVVWRGDEIAAVEISLGVR